MNNKEIENKVSKAFSARTPDVLDSVLSHCEEQKGSAITMTKKSNKTIWIRTLAATAAMLLLVFGGIFGWQQYSANAVAGTVSLDVNPSIEIDINGKEKVLEVKALNDDGKIVVGDMSLRGTSLDVAVNALIGSMLKNGYLDSDTNSVLISVDAKSQGKSAEIQEKLTTEVSKILESDSINGAVITQAVRNKNKQLQQQAQENNISCGKANFINEIIANDPYYTFEELAKLSVHELNLLMKNAEISSENIINSGTPSESRYIGKEKAEDIAVKHVFSLISAVSINKAERIKTEFDFDDGKAIYEVEFYIGSIEYDVDVDAISGNIIKVEKDYDGNGRPDAAVTPDTPADPATRPETPDIPDFNPDLPEGVKPIGHEKALDAALARINASLDGITLIKNEFEYDDGKWQYEIEFICGHWEYEVTVDGNDGKIIEFDREIADGDGKGNQGNHSGQGNQYGKPDDIGNGNDQAVITKEEAIRLAFDKAGLAYSDTAFDKHLTDVTFDCENGKCLYEVEFEADGYEYSVEINAKTGTVIDFEKERDD